MASYPDHFSSTAASYASYRPLYPAGLFAWLATSSPHRRLGWDCGTGSGQAAVALSEHFGHVVATDPSAAQLAHAERRDRVSYVAMTAEGAALATGRVALVTVAQALHWFDQAAFFAEARRVLSPGGLLAVWSYGLCTLGDVPLDEALRRFHAETVGPYWPAERRLVDAGYATLELPFGEISAPVFRMRARWTLEQFAGYLSTWSAVQRARAATGSDPLPSVVETLAARWGERGSVRAIEWPLALRVGYV